MPLLCSTVLFGCVLAVLAGIAVGLFGGGGSLLTVPILVYVLGLPAHEAITLSLVVVGTTSLVALVPHARCGRVRWKTGVIFGGTSMAAAYAAARVAHHLPSTFLLLLFGGLMLIAAIAMMRGREPASASECELREPALFELPLAKIIMQGLGVGAIAGLLGAGGGFLVVPALVLLGGLPMRAAVGTSLLVIAMNSVAGLAGHLGTVSVDWPLAATITAAAVGGTLVGGTVAARVRQQLLRRGFAWFIVVIAAFVLLQEIPRALGLRIELATWWPLLLGLCAVPAALAIVDLARRSRAAA